MKSLQHTSFKTMLQYTPEEIGQRNQNISR